MRVVTIKFKVPDFELEARKWIRKNLELVQDELGMFDYEYKESPMPIRFPLFNGQKKTGRVVINKTLTAKEKKEKVNS